MDEQKHTTILDWIKERIKSVFAAISMLTAKLLLGQHLFEQEYRKLSTEEDVKKLFSKDPKEKEQSEEKTKEAEQKDEKAMDEVQEVNLKEVMNSEVSFQEMVQAEDPEFLNDLTEYLKSLNLNVTKSMYSDNSFGKSIQLEFLDKDQQIQTYSITEQGNSNDDGFSKHIEKYCIDHGISTFLTQEKQMMSLIKEIQKSELEGNDGHLYCWNHSYKINSENGKTRVMLDNKEVFSGQLDLPRFEADNVNVFIISDQKLIDMNQHALSNMIEALYREEIENLGYEIVVEKDQIQLENVMKMETSFQDIMKQQDLGFLDKLRESLCQETGMNITTSYVLPPKDLEMHGKDSLLQINLEEGDQEQHILIDEYGCILGNETKNEDILNAMQQICIQENIALLPNLKDFTDRIFEEAKYDVVLGNESSSLNFWGNEIIIHQENTDAISIHCNGRQLYAGGLGNLMDPDIVQDIYKGVYEESLSYLGYDVIEHTDDSYEHTEQDLNSMDIQSFSEREMEAAEQDIMMEQQSYYEDELAEEAFYDHSECCASDTHEEENFLWEENYDDR